MGFGYLFTFKNRGQDMSSGFFSALFGMFFVYFVPYDQPFLR